MQSVRHVDAGSGHFALVISPSFHYLKKLADDINLYASLFRQKQAVKKQANKKQR